MVHKIRTYGDSSLRGGSEPVTEFDDELRATVDSMIETMYEEMTGVGLAAPQVGIAKKIVVFDLSMGEDEDSVYVLINPEIVEKEGECVLEEGCLSVPGVFEEVKRAYRVVVRYQDVEGNEHEQEAEDFLARVIQHEVDHLEGVLFVDRLGTVKRTLLAKTLRSLAQEGGTGT